MVTHSSVLAWGMPGTGEPGGLPLWGCTESDTTEATQQQQQQHSNKAMQCSPFKQVDEVTFFKTLGLWFRLITN